MITQNASNKILKTNQKKSGEKTNIIIVYLLFLMDALFIFYGGDNGRYEDVVVGAANFVSNDYENSYGLEKIYYYIARISAGSFIVWKILVYGGGLLLAYFTSLRLKSNNYLFLYAFVLFVLNEYGSSRVAFAIAIYLFGLSLIDKDNIKQSLLGICVAALSINAHSSMLMPVILIPALFVKITKTRFFILLLLLPLLAMIISSIPDYLVGSNTDLYESRVGYKWESYSETSGTTTRSSFLLFVYDICLYACIYFFLLFSIKADNKHLLSFSQSVIVRVSFFIVYFSFAILFSNIIIKDTLFYRYLQMIPGIMYVILPVLLTNNKNISPKSKEITEFLAISLNILFLIRIAYYSASN